ncbi:MAG: insulinase family protein [Geminicoccaceae bacterium]
MGMFHPQTFTLDNGMQVVVIENHRAPVVSHWVWYRVGTADSPPGKSGLPHFLEHLMFKGTEAMPRASSRRSWPATAATTTP